MQSSYRDLLEASIVFLLLIISPAIKESSAGKVSNHKALHRNVRACERGIKTSWNHLTILSVLPYNDYTIQFYFQSVKSGNMQLPPPHYSP